MSHSIHHAVIEKTSSPRYTASFGRERLLLALLCVLGAALSSYWLARVPLDNVAAVKGLDELLATRWGWIFGGRFLYVIATISGVTIAFIGMVVFGNHGITRLAWYPVVALAALLAAIAVWHTLFLMVLLGELRGNTWYVLPLACGTCAAVLVFASMPTPGTLRRLGLLIDYTGIILSGKRVAIAQCLGAIAGVVILVAQAYSATPPDAGQLALIQRLHTELMVGDGADRTFMRNGGLVPLRLDAIPIIGSPESPHIILFYFDYTDPSSCYTHAVLKEVRSRYQDQIAVAAIVCPMDTHLNPWIDGAVAAAHANAGVYARLSLAVWNIAPQVWQAFHDYLLTPVKSTSVSGLPEAAHIPDLPAAHARAAELIGRDALEQALRNPSIDQQLALYIQARAPEEEAQVGSTAWRPITLWFIKSPDAPGYMAQSTHGPLTSSTMMFSALESALGIAPVHSRTESEDAILRKLQ